jgi:ABC-2 type transport system ATP-binding protein
VIELSKLTKTFKHRRVLDELSLTIETGEHVALVGSNGAGKTTMIRCILGEYLHQGTVRVAGKDPRSDRAEVLAHVGFVPQLPPPLRMPVRELIHFSAAVSGTDPERITTVATRLGLDAQSFASQPFAKLSGGQKQKLLIAVALGRDADLLIMDEPAANLDPEARGTFFGLLAERAEESTMLISSHRLDEVAALVNRVVELDQGKVVLDDRVLDANLGGLIACRLELRRSDATVAKALEDWGLTPHSDTLWTGQIPGADRLRFLGLLSRYVGVVRRVSLDEKEEEVA